MSHFRFTKLKTKRHQRKCISEKKVTELELVKLSRLAPDAPMATQEGKQTKGFGSDRESVTAAKQLDKSGGRFHIPPDLNPPTWAPCPQRTFHCPASVSVLLLSL